MKGICCLACCFSIVLGSKDSTSEFFVLTRSVSSLRRKPKILGSAFSWLKTLLNWLRVSRIFLRLSYKTSLHTTFPHIHSSIHTLQNLLWIYEWIRKFNGLVIHHMNPLLQVLQILERIAKLLGSCSPFSLCTSTMLKVFHVKGGVCKPGAFVKHSS